MRKALATIAAVGALTFGVMTATAEATNVCRTGYGCTTTTQPTTTQPTTTVTYPTTTAATTTTEATTTTMATTTTEATTTTQGTTTTIATTTTGNVGICCLQGTTTTAPTTTAATTTAATTTAPTTTVALPPPTDAPSTTVAPTTVPERLPDTGPGDYLLWLAVAAFALIFVGAMILHPMFNRVFHR